MLSSCLNLNEFIARRQPLFHPLFHHFLFINSYNGKRVDAFSSRKIKEDKGVRYIYRVHLSSAEKSEKGAWYIYIYVR